MATNHHETLTRFWAVVYKLRPDSPADTWHELTALVSPECVIHLMGVAAPPSRGPAELIASFKTLTSTWALKERRVVSTALSADGRTAVGEMDNHIVVLGTDLEHFRETEIVEFDDAGLILNYRLYLDPSPVMKIFSDKGFGASAA